MSVELGAEFDVVRDVGEDFMEVRDGGGEIRECGRLIGAAEEVGAGVAEDAVHMADEFVWSADLRGGAEVCELGWSIAEGFLSSVGEGCEEVF